MASFDFDAREKEDQTDKEARITAEVNAFTITDSDSLTAAMNRAMELYKAGMPAQAFVLFQKGADCGCAPAQTLLANLYYTGSGTEKDLKKAMYWFIQSAKLGNPKAQHAVACMFLKGEGAEKSNLDALKWFQAAAEQGYEASQKFLAQNFDTEEKRNAFITEGCFQNYQSCLKNHIDEDITLSWLKRAAEQGHPLAQFNLGRCYHDGCGVEVDRQQAILWWTKAAEQGDAAAQLNLGIHYHAEGDDQQAFYWYSKAAEQGKAQAQYNLGVCYTHGNGVAANRQQAVYWYTKAAEQGDTLAREALMILGLMDCFSGK